MSEGRGVLLLLLKPQFQFSAAHIIAERERRKEERVLLAKREFKMLAKVATSSLLTF